MPTRQFSRAFTASWGWRHCLVDSLAPSASAACSTATGPAFTGYPGRTLVTATTQLATSASSATRGSRFKGGPARILQAQFIHTTTSSSSSSSRLDADSSYGSIVEAAILAAAEAADAAKAAYPLMAAKFDVDSSSQLPRGSCVTTVKGLPAIFVSLCKKADLPEGIRVPKFTQKFQTYLQAACAGELGRLALVGGLQGADNVKLNFPAALYTSQQVAAVATLMQARKQNIPNLQLELPGLAAAASGAADTSSGAVAAADQPAAAAAAPTGGRVTAPPRAVIHMLETAVRDAVAAAAAELRRGLTEQPKTFRGVYYEPAAAGRAARAKPYQMKFKVSKKRFGWWCPTAVEAAVAYDLTTIAWRGPKAAAKEDYYGPITNFPVSAYTEQQITAVRQLLKAKHGLVDAEHS